MRLWEAFKLGPRCVGADVQWLARLSLSRSRSSRCPCLARAFVCACVLTSLARNRGHITTTAWTTPKSSAAKIAFKLERANTRRSSKPPAVGLAALNPPKRDEIHVSFVALPVALRARSLTAQKTRQGALRECSCFQSKAFHAMSWRVGQRAMHACISAYVWAVRDSRNLH